MFYAFQLYDSNVSCAIQYNNFLLELQVWNEIGIQMRIVSNFLESLFPKQYNCILLMQEFTVLSKWLRLTATKNTDVIM